MNSPRLIKLIAERGFSFGGEEKPSRGGQAEKIWLGALAHREAYRECVTATHGANVTGKPLIFSTRFLPSLCKRKKEGLAIGALNLSTLTQAPIIPARTKEDVRGDEFRVIESLAQVLKT